PFQAEWRLDVEIVPALFGRAFVLEVVDVEAYVVDGFDAVISRIRRRLLRPPPRAPVEFEAGGVTPEYFHDAPERLDVFGFMPAGEPRHFSQHHLSSEPNDRLRMRL